METSSRVGGCNIVLITYGNEVKNYCADNGILTLAVLQTQKEWDNTVWACNKSH